MKAAKANVVKMDKRPNRIPIFIEQIVCMELSKVLQFYNDLSFHFHGKLPLNDGNILKAAETSKLF